MAATDNPTNDEQTEHALELRPATQSKQSHGFVESRARLVVEAQIDYLEKLVVTNETIIAWPIRCADPPAIIQPDDNDGRVMIKPSDSALAFPSNSLMPTESCDEDEQQGGISNLSVEVKVDSRTVPHPTHCRAVDVQARVHIKQKLNTPKHLKMGTGERNEEDKKSGGSEANQTQEPIGSDGGETRPASAKHLFRSRVAFSSPIDPSFSGSITIQGHISPDGKVVLTREGWPPSEGPDLVANGFTSQQKQELPISFEQKHPGEDEVCEVDDSTIPDKTSKQADIGPKFRVFSQEDNKCDQKEDGRLEIHMSRKIRLQPAEDANESGSIDGQTMVKGKQQKHLTGSEYFDAKSDTLCIEQVDESKLDGNVELKLGQTYSEPADGEEPGIASDGAVPLPTDGPTDVITPESQVAEKCNDEGQDTVQGNAQADPTLPFETETVNVEPEKPNSLIEDKNELPLENSGYLDSTVAKESHAETPEHEVKSDASHMDNEGEKQTDFDIEHHVDQVESVVEAEQTQIIELDPVMSEAHADLQNTQPMVPGDKTELVVEQYEPNPEAVSEVGKSEHVVMEREKTEENGELVTVKSVEEQGAYSALPATNIGEKNEEQPARTATERMQGSQIAKAVYDDTSKPPNDPSLDVAQVIEDEPDTKNVLDTTTEHVRLDTEGVSQDSMKASAGAEAQPTNACENAIEHQEEQTMNILYAHPDGQTVVNDVNTDQPLIHDIVVTIESPDIPEPEFKTDLAEQTVEVLPSMAVPTEPPEGTIQTEVADIPPVEKQQTIDSLPNLDDSQGSISPTEKLYRKVAAEITNNILNSTGEKLKKSPELLRQITDVAEEPTLVAQDTGISVESKEVDSKEGVLDAPENNEVKGSPGESDDMKPDGQMDTNELPKEAEEELLESGKAMLPEETRTGSQSPTAPLHELAVNSEEDRFQLTSTDGKAVRDAQVNTPGGALAFIQQPNETVDSESSQSMQHYRYRHRRRYRINGYPSECTSPTQAQEWMTSHGSRHKHTGAMSAIEMDGSSKKKPLGVEEQSEASSGTQTNSDASEFRRVTMSLLNTLTTTTELLRSQLKRHGVTTKSNKHGRRSVARSPNNRQDEQTSKGVRAPDEPATMDTQNASCAEPHLWTRRERSSLGVRHRQTNQAILDNVRRRNWSTCSPREMFNDWYACKLHASFVHRLKQPEKRLREDNTETTEYTSICSADAKDLYKRYKHRERDSQSFYTHIKTNRAEMDPMPAFRLSSRGPKLAEQTRALQEVVEQESFSTLMDVNYCLSPPTQAPINLSLTTPSMRYQNYHYLKEQRLQHRTQDNRLRDQEQDLMQSDITMCRAWGYPFGHSAHVSPNTSSSLETSTAISHSGKPDNTTYQCVLGIHETGLMKASQLSSWMKHCSETKSSGKCFVQTPDLHRSEEKCSWIVHERARSHSYVVPSNISLCDLKPRQGESKVTRSNLNWSTCLQPVIGVRGGCSTSESLTRNRIQMYTESVVHYGHLSRNESCFQCQPLRGDLFITRDQSVERLETTDSYWNKSSNEDEMDPSEGMVDRLNRSKRRS